MSDILTDFAKCGTSGFKWVARNSSTGRGLRLHQCPAEEASFWPGGGHDTPQEAIGAFFKAEAIALRQREAA